MKLRMMLTVVSFASLSAMAETRVLLPVFLPEIEGTFGARFVTSLTVYNDGENILLRGVRANCPVICPSDQEPQLPLGPASGFSDFDLLTHPGNPGRVVHLPDGARTFFGIRVFDRSDIAGTNGVEIPVVPETALRSTPLSLVGIPHDVQSRKALRIYSFADTEVTVRMFGPEDRFQGQLLAEHHVRLTGAAPFGGSDLLFQPAVAQMFSGTPGLDLASRLEIVPSTSPVWAMISITNNVTQAITVVTPQPAF